MIALIFIPKAYKIIKKKLKQLALKYRYQYHLNLEDKNSNFDLST